MYFSGSSSVFRRTASCFLMLLVGNWHHGVMCDQQASAIATNEVGISAAATNNSPNGNTLSKLHQNSFVSSGGSPSAPSAIPVSGDEQYRATYFYPVPHHVNWNRDSYADAASEFGYNQQQQQQQHHQQQTSATVSGPVFSSAYGVSGESEGYEDSSFGGSLGGLGGLGGIAGILGLKGIKGLGILGLAKAAVPILAIVLPALLLLPLIFLFFPVPVITVPATGQRGLNLISGLGLGELSGKVSNLARSVLESDKCVERISCEMSRVSRGTFIDRTLKRVIPRFESRMPQTLRRIARVYMEGQPSGASSCSKKYNCYLMDDSSGSNQNSYNLTAKKASTSS